MNLKDAVLNLIALIEQAGESLSETQRRECRELEAEIASQITEMRSSAPELLKECLALDTNDRLPVLLKNYLYEIILYYNDLDVELIRAYASHLLRHASNWNAYAHALFKDAEYIQNHPEIFNPPPHTPE